MSIFLGDQLNEVIEKILQIAHEHESKSTQLSFHVNALPALPRDATDRNRTSPFAFTGNKFEFRAVGSSQSCARPAMLVNTIAAESINYMADELEKELKSGKDLDTAVHLIIKNVLKDHSRVIFNGNNYSDEWVQEAGKRGLPNFRTLPDAIQQLTTDKNVKLFESLGILTKKEIMGQQNIIYENFCKVIIIEADCMESMITSSVVPAALEYRGKLANSINKDSPMQQRVLKKLDAAIDDLLTRMEELKNVRSKLNLHKMEEEGKYHEASVYCRKEVVTAMDSTRVACDLLETLVDDKMWPFPKYSEILFMK